MAIFVFHLPQQATIGLERQIVILFLGRPVVGARIGGIPELIRETETGFGFESGSAEALAATMEQVSAMSDEDVASMGRRGRSWMEESFTSNVYFERLTALYAELGVE